MPGLTAENLAFHMQLDVAAPLNYKSETEDATKNPKLYIDEHVRRLKAKADADADADAAKNKENNNLQWDPTKEVLVFFADGKAYAANPLRFNGEIEGVDSADDRYLCNHLKSYSNNHGYEYSVLTYDEYNELVKQKGITPNTTDSWQWVQGVAIGDMTWYALCAVILELAGEKALATMTWIFPPLLGTLVFLITYHNEVQRFIRDNGREPTAEERKIIFQDSMAVGVKMTAAVFGWTLAAELVAPQLLKLASLWMLEGGKFALGTSTNIGANFLFAATVGVFAGTFIFFGAIAMHKGPLSSQDWNNVIKVTCCAMVAGFAWGLAAALPAWIGGDKVFEYVYAAAAVFLGVGLSFSLYDPKKVWHTLTKKDDGVTSPVFGSSPLLNMATLGTCFNAPTWKERAQQKAVNDGNNTETAKLILELPKMTA